MRCSEWVSVVDLMRRRYERAGARTSSRGTIRLRPADEVHLLLR
jgi:hypothetical protein